MLGAVVAAAVGHRVRRFPVLMVALVLCGAPRFWTLAATDSVVAVVLVTVASGFAGGFVNPLIGALVFERVPASMVGRVPALVNAAAWAPMPVGVLLGGVVVAAGPAVALGAAGFVYLVAVLGGTAVPAFRRMDRDRRAGAALRTRSGAPSPDG
ncbi:MFS transporter [Pseudonocardia sp. HH130630-07]|uniref:MFS transporter n=1 Tax=Pseudonocardia sp. HH130630-07 TaxID=1690815 RepID=UPI0012EA34AC|nr:MFS transporter [Pseudonocardia sp. HH130630-07]